MTNVSPLHTCLISHFHISDIWYETDKKENTHYKCINNAGNLGQGQYNAQKHYKLALENGCITTNHIHIRVQLLRHFLEKNLETLTRKRLQTRILRNLYCL